MTDDGLRRFSKDSLANEFGLLVAKSVSASERKAETRKEKEAKATQSLNQAKINPKALV